LREITKTYPPQALPETLFQFTSSRHIGNIINTV